MNTNEHWSRQPGFFGLTIPQRRAVVLQLPLDVTEEDFRTLDQGLALEVADRISENTVGIFSLPLSVAVNFIINGHPVLVPMVTEEPSIVAACSKMAKLTASHGGFVSEVDASLIKGQIQIYNHPDVDKALAMFAEHKPVILTAARNLCVSMHNRGGGVRDITMRVALSSSIGPMLLIEPLIDVVDAMGANIVNTLLEGLAGTVHEIIGGDLGARILSNYCDQRRARARCRLSFRDLAFDKQHDNGAQVAKRLRAIHALAEADVYRACTHNKGILNGIDAVAVATGNDFRAIEAGAHAYASRTANYLPLTRIIVDEEHEEIHAEIDMPLAVGVVGGLLSVHPGVKLAHKILGSFAYKSSHLATVMVSVGLSQCLAALVALSQEGIQKGHMALHHKKITAGTRHAHAQ